MKRSRPILISLCLPLLGLMPSCSTPGTTTGGSGIGSGLGSFAEAILDIPMTILSIPADILGDPSTMGALAQATSSYSSSSSSYDSGSSYGSSSYDSSPSYSSSSGGGSGYSSSSSYVSSPRYADSSGTGAVYTGVSPKMRGEESPSASYASTSNTSSTGSDDNGYQEGLRNFHLTQQRKVEAYKQAAAQSKKVPEPTPSTPDEPTGFSGFRDGYFYTNGKITGRGGWDEKTKTGWLAR